MEILCEAECITCVARDGRLRSYNPISKVFYCEECHKVYFCEVGIHKEFIPEMRYRCPNCRSIMVYTTMKTVLERKIDHARSLGVSVYNIEQFSPLRNIIAPHSLLEEMMQQRSLVATTEVTSRGVPTSEIQSDSLIFELLKIEGLDSLLLLDILQVLGTPLTDVTSAAEVPEILQLLAERNPEALTKLFDIMIRNAIEIHPRGLLMKFALYLKQVLPDVGFIRLHPVEKDFLPFVSSLIIHKDNLESWVIYFDTPIVDLDHLNEIITPLMSQPPALYASLKEVHLLGREFSWMVQQMMVRYGKITVRRDLDDEEATEDEVPIRLWVPHAERFRELRTA